MNVRTKAIAGIIGVFVVGGLFGAIGAGLYVQSQVDEARALRDQDGFRRHFTEQLELSTAQLADFEEELIAAHEQIIGIREQASDEYEIIFDSLEARIGPKLSDQQRLMLQRHRRRLLMRHRPPAGHLRHRAGPPGIDAEGETGELSATDDAPHGLPEDLEERVDPVQAENEREESADSASVETGMQHSMHDTAHFGASKEHRHDAGLKDRPASRKKILAHIAQLRSALDLDPSQQNLLDSALATFLAEETKIRRELRDRPFLLRRKSGANRRALDRAINGFLDDEQRAAYRRLKRDWMRRKRKSRTE